MLPNSLFVASAVLLMESRGKKNGFVRGTLSKNVFFKGL